MSLLLSTIVAVKSWRKSRFVHSLEEFVLRKINGGRGDLDRGIKEINEKLKNRQIHDTRNTRWSRWRLGHFTYQSKEMITQSHSQN